MATCTDNVGRPDKLKSKKRHTSEPKSQDDDTKSSPKKTKLEHAFTEIEFKVMLKDPNTSFAALEKFITEAEKYPDQVKYDLVAGYCRSSGECAEIFHLLEAGHRKQSEVIFLDI
ncbi:hypothetical protein CHS0354_021325 [Potamilus streckersoni]|uniref:Uncharacterized protein n=1 Tax=Potamilus streckersoni TaxID=2493646 RepID=A0AAE0TL48_9BIVA|nr:hypothetical protein CHS0354_021325 [Potamilus streckersoni]